MSFQKKLRYFLEIAYNGGAYFGWQIQPDAVSIQEVLERGLSTILQKEIKVVGAGRTDTGVHARQLFVHVDLDNNEDVANFIFKINSILPRDILVRDIHPVNNDAHARFDAIEREYEYWINLVKDPFSQEFAYQIHNRPNIDLMNEAAAVLLEYRDFQCFSRTKTNVKTYHCVIKKAVWTLDGNRLIFTISADRFLRNMVRAIVGTLLDVGYEKISMAQFHAVLESKNRSEAGKSAPAHGLYLTKVMYPDDIFIK